MGTTTVASFPKKHKPRIVPLNGAKSIAVLKIPDDEMSANTVEQLTRQMKQILPKDVIAMVIPATWSFEVISLDGVPAESAVKLTRKDAPWYG